MSRENHRIKSEERKLKLAEYSARLDKDINDYDDIHCSGPGCRAISTCNRNQLPTDTIFCSERCRMNYANRNGGWLKIHDHVPDEILERLEKLEQEIQELKGKA